MQEIQVSGGATIKAWADGVPFDDKARLQVEETARLPFIHHHLAVMPDVHWGMGATIGSVVPTVGAIVPAAVGVDIGCGMMAVRTSLEAGGLPDSLAALRSAIEQRVPHGRTDNGGYKDEGSHRGRITDSIRKVWVDDLEPEFNELLEIDPSLEKSNHLDHLGTLGTGNHFIEVCLDERDRVWFMLHSGSRGIGNRIGMTYIRKAQKLAGHYLGLLPNKDLAFLSDGMPAFKEYVKAVGWAQKFASLNREIMMAQVVLAARSVLCDFRLSDVAINCHHNYVAREHHFGKNVWVTRKGAVRAREGDLGIIPGSMGARSYIVEGLGNPDSFHTCSHGAGRAMSRGEAKRRISVKDHERATDGVECRKDVGVLDESPAAYKDIDAVMAAQEDLVSVLHTLRQVVCVKG